MKQLSIRLSGDWVLQHKNDDKLPVKAFMDLCTEKFGDLIKISHTSLTECVLIFDESKLSCEEVSSHIGEILFSRMGIEKDSGIADISINDYNDPVSDDKDKTDSDHTEKDDDKGSNPPKAEEAKETDNDTPQEESMFDRLRRAFDQTSASETTVSVPSRPTGERIEELLGAESFKSLLNETKLVAPRLIEEKSQSVFASRKYLFSINSGHGLTTFLNLFADVINEEKLFTFVGNSRVIEEKLMPPGSGNAFSSPFQPVLAHFDGPYSREKALFCIDISEWMTKLGDAEFRNFISFLNANSSKNIYVFRIPFVESDVLESISGVLEDILTVRTVSFRPLSSEELVESGKRYLNKFGFEAEEGVWGVFSQRIIDEKRDGRFYGLCTVEKVVNEMVYYKYLSDAESGTKSMNICPEDIKLLTDTVSGNTSDGIEDLSDLIGMEEVTKSVMEIIAQIELAKDNSALGDPCLHMRFVGNPGTGKTTVARLVGKILKERGILRNGSFFEYSGRDFCGRYVGETAPKTASMCRDAYGSVLFIDEAYSLYKGDESKVDYGREALDTLIAEMENHRKDLVVIMAGYTDEMAELMNGNSGLESRMPYLIEFPNYTKEQLSQIFLQMAKKVPCEEGFAEVVEAYFNTLPDETVNAKEFSNARFVRNIFERTCAKAAVRMQFDNETHLTLTKNDFALASSDRTFNLLMKQTRKHKIGF